jgi:hypothetical protein
MPWPVLMKVLAQLGSRSIILLATVGSLVVIVLLAVAGQASNR